MRSRIFNLGLALLPPQRRELLKDGKFVRYYFNSSINSYVDVLRNGKCIWCNCTPLVIQNAIDPEVRTPYLAFFHKLLSIIHDEHSQSYVNGLNGRVKQFVDSH